jgi:hypothetical protein
VEKTNDAGRRILHFVTYGRCSKAASPELYGMTGSFVRRLALAFISVALVTGCGSQGPAPGVPATLRLERSSAPTSGPMLYVTNLSTQDPGSGSVLGFAANANGNVRPTVRIAGPRTGLGFDSASIAIDKLGRLYTTGTDQFLNKINIWRSGSNGDTKPTAHFTGYCDNFTPYPMVLAFDRFGHLWAACSSEGGGELVEYPIIQAGFTGWFGHFFVALRNIHSTDSFNGFKSIALNSNGQVSVEKDDRAARNRVILTFAVKQKGGFAPLSRLRGNKTQLDGQDDISYNSGGGISYDSQERLVACSNRKDGGRVLTFAPGANGNVAPISTLSVIGCNGVAVDPQDNIYVTFAGSITEYAAGASGSAQPLRVISGDLTGLSNATSIAFKR